LALPFGGLSTIVSREKQPTFMPPRTKLADRQRKKEAQTQKDPRSPSRVEAPKLGKKNLT